MLLQPLRAAAAAAVSRVSLIDLVFFMEGKTIIARPAGFGTGKLLLKSDLLIEKD
jgi:hypothetical protein